MSCVIASRLHPRESIDTASGVLALGFHWIRYVISQDKGYIPMQFDPSGLRLYKVPYSFIRARTYSGEAVEIHIPYRENMALGGSSLRG